MTKNTAQKQPKETLTPMMAQYYKIKADNPDCLLFYRMGDFYEMFMEDAVKASAVLNIALTKRGKSDGTDIPMCGVPWHSHESYLARLIKHGFKVAICEQTETPAQAKKRGGYKALVNREVIRIVTQGTLTEETLLEKNINNYLLCIAEVGDSIGLSWLDLSCGDFTLQPVLRNNLLSAIGRINPQEILLSDRLTQNPELFETFAEYKDKLTIQPHSRFDSENSRKRLETLFEVSTLESFGDFSRAEIAAGGALIDYIYLTQKGKMPRISKPKQLSVNSVMEIDAATRRNLELTHTMNGEKKGSLLHAIDMTVTGAGARLLAKNISMPLTQPNNINHRLDMLEFFITENNIREDIRNILKTCSDIERAIGRLSLERGGPRDIAAIKNTLSKAVSLSIIISNANKNIPLGIVNILKSLNLWGEHNPLINQLGRALKDELPMLTRDGGFIKQGYSPKLDEYQSLKTKGKDHVAALKVKYARQVNIPNLRIKHNNIIGYHIEVSSNNADALFADKENFIHRQTLATVARFTTVDLSDLEKNISEASVKSLALELEIFKDLVSEILSNSEIIIKTAEALAELDVSSALAELAVKNNYTRPLIDNSLTFDIKGGRHPVVENAIKATENKDFIANDCDLAENSRLWLLTGPNMAGKSTFLRQNALITLMGHIGSYVPASNAHIGTIDRLFSRVGAADDLARGRSTFMVEMVETATILNQATSKSLVILDEIGRGTATYDGLSIAWGCLEYLHEENKCRTIFATHYHELTSLSESLSALSCHSMKVKEWKDNIIFLHEVIKGTADRSYGIHVAKLAGLPPAVIIRAEEVLKNIEGQKNIKTKLSANDLPLFSVVPVKKNSNISKTEEALKDINPDNLSPRKALEALYKLKSLSES